MTVAELITKLKKLPQDLPVVAYDGYEPCGLQTVKEAIVSTEDFRSPKSYHKDTECVLLVTP